MQEGSLTAGKQIIVMDFDDVSVATPEISLLSKLREHIPQFKVSAFTVPVHEWLMQDEKRFSHLMLWANALRDMPWMEIEVHGFLHDKSEMMVDYEIAKATILSSQRAFTEFKIKEKRKFFGSKWVHYKPNIPYQKIFKAPGWQMSNEAYLAARDLGYVVATDRNHPDVEVPGLRTYRFNWSIEEPFPKEYRVVKGHGHIIGMANDLSINYTKLLHELPTDAVYMTISEYLKWEDEHGKQK